MHMIKKSLLKNCCYNIVWMKTEYLFFLWTIGLFFIFLSCIGYRNHISLGQFLSTSNYQLTEGKFSGIKAYHKDSGTRSPYVELELQDGRKYYDMSYNFYAFNWEERFSKVEEGDAIQLLTYRVRNGQKADKFISVSSNGKTILSLDEVKEVCETYYLKTIKTAKKDLLFGIVLSMAALIITIFRRI